MDEGRETCGWIHISVHICEDGAFDYTYLDISF